MQNSERSGSGGKRYDAPVGQRQLFTTGEAARLLNISRSTVSRKFDKGILQGKKNPITGERLISYKSLEALIKQHDLHLPPQPAEKKKILLVSSDRLLRLLMQKNFSADERFEIHSVSLGCEALAFCSRENPQLMIIDEELPDMACSVVLKSARQIGPKDQPKTICYTKTGNAENCVTCGCDEIFTKGAMDEDRLLRKVNALMDLSGTEPTVHAFEHHRRWPRVSIDLPAKIGVYPLNEPRLRYHGKATMKNLSHGGAYLSSITMDDGMIPSDPFRLILEVDVSPLKNWRADCKVVRLESDESLGAGVQFLQVSGSNLQKIEAILGD